VLCSHAELLQPVADVQLPAGSSQTLLGTNQRKKLWSNGAKNKMALRTVPPFVTADTFCTSRDIWVS